MNVRRDSLITAIVCLVLLLVAAIVALALVPHDSDSTPFVTALIGVIAPTIAALVALLKLDEVRDDVQKVKDDVAEVHSAVNGVEEKTAAIAEAASEHS